VQIFELHPFNRPDLTFWLDAADVHLLAKCKRWRAIKKPRSLTFYVQGCGGTDEPIVYLHRLITGAPKGMTVNHLNGDGLNCIRSNLDVVTQAVNAAHAINVLKRHHKPEGEPIENKVRKVLADGTIRIYVYDRRTGRRLRTWNENRSATKFANQTANQHLWCTNRKGKRDAKQ
jgi:hypothetical protein